MNDDKAQLADLHAAIEALKAAERALQFALVHHGPKSREAFVHNVGVARGRLTRVAARIHGEHETHEEASGESDP